MANPLNKNQTTFASRLIGDTGLDSDVITAWILSEEPASATAAPNGANNWLNVGSFDSGFTGGGNNVWDDPNSAADATAQWMQGSLSLPHVGHSALGIQHILSTVGQTPAAQIKAIQQSGWASSGYPNFTAVYNLVRGKGPAASATPFSTPAGQSAGAGNFTVGETTNPNEDYWTAINRLGSEVNWYVYTRLDWPKDVVFLADGTDLLQRKPIATIDRWFNQEAILYIDFTWDNTAFEFKAHHKKKKVTSQKRSNVASVTSPTECTLHLICNIDAFNPGDVIFLTSCGPGTGPWLVGEVRRSIFQIYSELTLVPGIMPITANAQGPNIKDINENINATGTSTAGGGSGSGSGSGAAVISVGGYVNPLSQIKNLEPSRTDMGVDYTGSGPLLAIGDGKVGNVYNSGWPGGAYISLTLSGGTYAGKIVYYAENITPKVAVGQTVKAGDVIGTLGEAYPHMEIGWSANTGGTALAASLGQQYPGNDPGAWESAAGASMSRFLQSLGAPPGTGGHPISGGPHGKMPAGYP